MNNSINLRANGALNYENFDKFLGQGGLGQVLPAPLRAGGQNYSKSALKQPQITITQTWLKTIQSDLLKQSQNGSIQSEIDPNNPINKLARTGSYQWSRKLLEQVRHGVTQGPNGPPMAPPRAPLRAQGCHFGRCGGHFGFFFFFLGGGNMKPTSMPLLQVPLRTIFRR